MYRYIGTKSTISKIDKRLLQIKLPNNFMRSPRSITQRQYWKGKTNKKQISMVLCILLVLASEWKCFLLLCIPSVLFRILPDKYYVHTFLLIKSIRILLNNTVSEETLHLAEKLLKRFCELMEIIMVQLRTCIHACLC